MTQPLQTLLDNLHFPEGPRWHAESQRLYLSDFYAYEVLTVSLDGTRETVCQVENQPSGLGFTPDGELLVVSMLDRKLLKLSDGELSVSADLSKIVSKPCNDMVVDSAGRAYIGNFGFERHKGDEPCTTVLVRATLDGTVTVVSEDVYFPNGSVITPDRTLIVGETYANRLTAWTIDDAGDLSHRRVWADLGDFVPDGICLDEEGAIWVADPRAGCVVRVAEGGKVLDRLDTTSAQPASGEQHRGAYACMLGGPERRHLFVLTNTTSGPEAKVRRDGRVEVVEVEVPGVDISGPAISL